MSGSDWFENRVEKKDSESAEEVMKRVSSSSVKEGEDPAGDDLIARIERLHQLSYKVRYYLLIGMILILVGFAIVPRFFKNDKLHLSVPLDLGKFLYFRTEEGNWLKMSIEDDDVYDALSDLIKGTYAPKEKKQMDRDGMAVIFVCRVEDGPMHMLWFDGGSLCDMETEDTWVRYEREETPFSYDALLAFITEHGKAVAEEDLPDWMEDVK
ncbi:MAG: hypothetical protein J5865_04175 [Lachnospiraceae bacterium]|nr:hypothetical protein [Lachnospiraceae bacterium]